EPDQVQHRHRPQTIMTNRIEAGMAASAIRAPGARRVCGNRRRQPDCRARPWFNSLIALAAIVRHIAGSRNKGLPRTTMTPPDPFDLRSYIRTIPNYPKPGIQ